MIKMTKNKGFSLLEVLVAFLILTLTLVGATSLIIRNIKTNVNNRQMMTASMLVNNYIELIRAHPEKIDLFLDVSDIGVAASNDCRQSCTLEQLIALQKSLLPNKIDDLPNMQWFISKHNEDKDIYEIGIVWEAGWGVGLIRYSSVFSARK